MSCVTRSAVRAVVAFMVGLALVFRSWAGLSLAALVLLVALWRIQDEQALMRDTFGQQWDAYTQRSWRMVPFVY